MLLKKLEDVYTLSEKIVDHVNNFQANYVTETGKNVPSNDMIYALNLIVQEGFGLYKYIVDTKFYEGKPEITVDIVELEKHINSLQMTEKNAKNLDIKSAMNAWNASKIIIAKLACDILDYRDSLN